MPKYHATYNHRGGKHIAEFYATDIADAEERLSKLAWATLDGEVVAEVAVPNWFGKLMAKFK